jgi:hypothetical protein
MIRPELPYGEKEIRESYDIFVKDTEFNLFLTNRRLILLNDAKKINLEIRLKDIVGSGLWMAENGDLMIAVHVIRERKETRMLLMQFSQSIEDNRKDETDAIYSYIRASSRNNECGADPAGQFFQDKNGLQDGSQQPVLVKCKHCKKQVPANANYCIHCGKQFSVRKGEASSGNNFIRWFMGDKKKESKGKEIAPPTPQGKSSFSVWHMFSKKKSGQTENTR